MEDAWIGSTENIQVDTIGEPPPTTAVSGVQGQGESRTKHIVMYAVPMDTVAQLASRQGSDDENHTSSKRKKC